MLILRLFTILLLISASFAPCLPLLTLPPKPTKLSLAMFEIVPPALTLQVLPLKNPRWEDFCQKYMECETQTEAARAIGIRDDHATQEARRLMNTPLIQGRIAYLEQEEIKRALITEGTITEELAIIAFSSPDDYETGKLITDPVIKVKEGVNPKQIRAISEIEVSDSASGIRKVKFKLHSKTAALQMAMELKGYGVKNRALMVNKKADETQAVGSDGNGSGKESAEEILKAMGLRVA